ncbi:hypothetical protein hairong_106 [Pseudomonas phage hairong]|nr:hypothetical protein hairong_106 [Pseudomonas phage hairong]
MISNNILILFGYTILFAATCYVGVTTIRVLRASLAFAGRVSGEFVFFLIIFLLMAAACWWAFPFEVALKVVPVSVK